MQSIKHNKTIKRSPLVLAYWVLCNPETCGHKVENEGNFTLVRTKLLRPWVEIALAECQLYSLGTWKLLALKTVQTSTASTLTGLPETLLRTCIEMCFSLRVMDSIHRDAFLLNDKFINHGQRDHLYIVYSGVCGGIRTPRVWNCHRCSAFRL